MKKGDENRNIDASCDLDDAIDDWLGTREQWLGGCDPEKLERFTTARNVLYSAFARDWHGDERTLPVAFEQFREALVTDAIGATVTLKSGRSIPIAPSEIQPLPTTRY